MKKGWTYFGRAVLSLLVLDFSAGLRADEVVFEPLEGGWSLPFGAGAVPAELRVLGGIVGRRVVGTERY